MKQIRLQMISPHDFEVIRVISFSDSHLNKNGVIVYRRPSTLNYNKDVLDDFDESFIKWLKQLNFQNVTLWHSEDILFDNQLNHYQQVYDGGRPRTLLSLTCHGDYTNDELMRQGAIDAHILELPIYWNSSENYPIPVIGGVVTYDKTKEQYYIDSLSAIKPMS